MDTSSSGSMYRAGATEALAGKQGENTPYGRNVRLEQTNKTPPVQKTTANKIELQLRSSAQIPAPSHRRGSPPPSSKDGAAHTAPTNVNLNSGVTPFRSAIVNAVMDFEATVEQAKSNFKSSPGSDKNVLLTSINNATAILLHAIEGAMIDAQETKNTQVVHSKIFTNSKKIESGSSSDKGSSLPTHSKRMSELSKHSLTSRPNDSRVQPRNVHSSHKPSNSEKGFQTQTNSGGIKPTNNKYFTSNMKLFMTDIFHSVMGRKAIQLPHSKEPSMANSFTQESDIPPTNNSKPTNSTAPTSQPKLTATTLARHDAQMERLLSQKRNPLNTLARELEHKNVQLEPLGPLRTEPMESKKPHEIQCTSIVAKHTNSSTESGAWLSGLDNSLMTKTANVPDGIDAEIEELIINVHDAAIGIRDTNSSELEIFENLVNQSKTKANEGISYTSDTSSSYSLNEHTQKYTDAISEAINEFAEGRATREETNAKQLAAFNQLKKDL